MKNYSAFQSYYDEWQRSNEEARQHPLLPNTDLEPFNAQCWEYRVVPSRRKVGRPSLLLQDATRVSRFSRPRMLSLGSSGGWSIRLLRLLSGEGESWCQVWLAEIRFAESPPPESNGSLVVFKLFQESLFPEPTWDVYQERGLWTGRGLAGRENRAYRMLTTLQGIIIPYSYGFYEFLLPCGESTWGHIMEYIDGSPLERDWEAVQATDFWHSPDQVAKRERQMETFLLEVHELHQRGVVHRDLRGSNVLRTKYDDEFFVIIDLSLAAPLPNPKARSPSTAKIRDDLSGALECLRQIEEVPTLARWLKKRVAEHPPWARIFTTSPFALYTLEQTAFSQESEMREYAGLPAESTVVSP